MKNLTISIITPCFNSQKYLVEMINSVINQSYINWELLIVDDFSTDNSVKIIKKYINQDIRIKLIELKNRSGPAFVRNEGIKLAKGRYITFLDADDYWGKNFLKYSLDKIKNHTFVYSNYYRVNQDGKIIDQIKSVPKVDRNKILRGTPISCLTAFIDVNKIGKKFFPLNTFREDISFWTLILKDCNFAYGFNFCEAFYRNHKNSSSSNKLKMAIMTWKDYRNYHGLPFLKSLYFFSHYALNGIFKFLLFKVLYLFVKIINN